MHKAPENMLFWLKSKPVLNNTFKDMKNEGTCNGNKVGQGIEPEKSLQWGGLWDGRADQSGWR